MPRLFRSATRFRGPPRGAAQPERRRHRAASHQPASPVRAGSTAVRTPAVGGVAALGVGTGSARHTSRSRGLDAERPGALKAAAGHSSAQALRLLHARAPRRRRSGPPALRQPRGQGHEPARTVPSGRAARRTGRAVPPPPGRSPRGAPGPGRVLAVQHRRLPKPVSGTLHRIGAAGGAGGAQRIVELGSIPGPSRCSERRGRRRLSCDLRTAGPRRPMASLPAATTAQRGPVDFHDFYGAAPP